MTCPDRSVKSDYPVKLLFIEPPFYPQYLQPREGVRVPAPTCLCIVNHGLIPRCQVPSAKELIFSAAVAKQKVSNVGGYLLLTSESRALQRCPIYTGLIHKRQKQTLQGKRGNSFYLT